MQTEELGTCVDGVSGEAGGVGVDPGVDLLSTGAGNSFEGETWKRPTVTVDFGSALTGDSLGVCTLVPVSGATGGESDLGLEDEAVLSGLALGEDNDPDDDEEEEEDLERPD